MNSSKLIGRPTRRQLLGAVAALSLAGALPSQGSAATATPLVLAYTDGQVPAAYTNLQAFYAQLGAVGLGSTWSLLADGSLSDVGMSSTTQKIIKFAKKKALPLYPTVSDYSDALGDFDPAVSRGILANAAAREAALGAMLQLAVSQGFAGIDLDWEAVEEGNAAAFSSFVADLATRLHAQGLKLILSVPPKFDDTSSPWLAGYDYAALGASVDWLQVMTYDEVGPGWCTTGFNHGKWPGPESGLDWQQAVLGYTLARVLAAKVLSGLPAYGYDYSTGKVVHWSKYGKTIAAHAGAVAVRDGASATPSASWGAVTPQRDGKPWSKATRQPVLWFDDAQSLAAKTALVRSLGLGGTSVWAMGYEDAAFWGAVRSGLAP
ncbi:MAG TPA: glycosyl hydrolase family 18 protein [Ideonella sp.]|uniref:glycosyl hydrolase family 18 protein n=1 Tax=Ideonella sp. TaxID=1929293 RepID=UPI002BD70385|nr:glycosyl hydrolase family 18 protein [Ideonella sp.]HSI48410.1 glycosyl hydrolase family 18 protein [Ideonella sp.]